MKNNSIFAVLCFFVFSAEIAKSAIWCLFYIFGDLESFIWTQFREQRLLNKKISSAWNILQSYNLLHLLYMRKMFQNMLCLSHSFLMVLSVCLFSHSEIPCTHFHHPFNIPSFVILSEMSGFVLLLNMQSWRAAAAAYSHTAVALNSVRMFFQMLWNTLK